MNLQVELITSVCMLLKPLMGKGGGMNVGPGVDKFQTSNPQGLFIPHYMKQQPYSQNEDHTNTNKLTNQGLSSLFDIMNNPNNHMYLFDDVNISTTLYAQHTLRCYNTITSKVSRGITSFQCLEQDSYVWMYLLHTYYNVLTYSAIQCMQVSSSQARITSN